MSISGIVAYSDAIFDRVALGETFYAAAGGVQTQFKSLMSLGGASIGSQGVFEGVLFGGVANFESSKFGGALAFEKCEFRGTSSFAGMRCNDNLSLFGVELETTTFHAVRVEGNFGFADCTFKQTTDLSYLSISGNLVCSGCHFDGELILKDCKVRGELNLRSSTLCEVEWPRFHGHAVSLLC